MRRLGGRRSIHRLRAVAGLVLALGAWTLLPHPVAAQPSQPVVPRFAVEPSPIGLVGDVRPQQYLGVVGRRAAWLGTETGDAEIWVHPLKLAQRFRLDFRNKAEYKLSTVVGKPFPWGNAGERWAELVKEKTGGKINIKMYPGTSLVGGDQTKEFTAIRQGAIDLSIGSTINWSPQIKELNLFSMPFLMPDYKAIDALTQGEVGKELFKILSSKDVVPIAWGENGFRELSNTKRPIKTPDDLKVSKSGSGDPRFSWTPSPPSAPTRLK